MDEAEIRIAAWRLEGVHARFARIQLFAEDLQVVAGTRTWNTGGEVPPRVFIDPPHRVPDLDRDLPGIERVAVPRDHDINLPGVLPRRGRERPEHGKDEHGEPRGLPHGAPLL